MNYKNNFSLSKKTVSVVLLILSFATLFVPNTYGIIWLLLICLSGTIDKSLVIPIVVIDWLVGNLNPGLFLSDNITPITRFSLIYYFFLLAILNFFRISLNKGNDRKIRYEYIILVSALLIGVIHSSIFSFYPDVSILKLLNLFALFFIIIDWLKTTPNFQKEYSLKVTVSILSLIILTSIPLLFFDVGYLRDGSFQGILGHPQAFGIFLSLMSAMYFIIWHAYIEGSRYHLIILGISVIMLFMTSARTALLALLITITVYLFRYYFKPSYKKILVLSGYVLLLFSISNLYFIDEFLNKSGGDFNIINGYEISRGFLLAPMIDNMIEHPMGIGFGIQNGGKDFVIVYDSLFNLPISAPTEKGLLYLEIIEEFGIFLGSIILFILLKIGLYSLSSAKVGPMIVLCIMLINVAESTLLSPAGMGMLFIPLFLIGIYHPNIFYHKKVHQSPLV
jgi:hypothetical protein